MARVLIAWELGEAFGHLARCLSLADGLRRRGHQVVLALKDLRLPGGPEAAPGLTVLAAPQSQHRSAERTPPVNYAALLSHSGFSDAYDIAARLRAWEGIFSLARPALLLADHAPTALLAAHRAGLPHVAVGNGFSVPPAMTPWPSIRSWESVSAEVLRSAEDRLERVTHAAQKLLGGVVPVHPRALFGAHDVLDTFAELDHYGARAGGFYVGPIGSLREAMPIGWQGRKEHRILAYLRPAVPGFVTIVRVLARLDAEVLCVAPGLAPAMARRLATRNLRIALAPVDLRFMPEADLALSYGNAAFTTQALLAGVPLLMRPRYVEQALMAQRVEALGAGKMLAGRLDEESLLASMQSMLADIRYRESARSFQGKYREHSSASALALAIDSVEQGVLAQRNSRQMPSSASILAAQQAALH